MILKDYLKILVFVIKFVTITLDLSQNLLQKTLVIIKRNRLNLGLIVKFIIKRLPASWLSIALSDTDHNTSVLLT